MRLDRLLLSALPLVAACSDVDDPALGVQTSAVEPSTVVQTAKFRIHADGVNRCLDYGEPGARYDGMPVTLQPCKAGASQEILAIERAAEQHDFVLMTTDLWCLGAGLDYQSRLVLRHCNKDAWYGQRFAFDGDALYVGDRSAGHVERKLVLEPYHGRGSVGTEVVVDKQDTSDAEVMRFEALTQTLWPHSGFAWFSIRLPNGALRGDPAGDFAELFDRENGRWPELTEWGSVIVVAKGTKFSTGYSHKLYPGVTVRGDQRRSEERPEIWVPLDTLYDKEPLRLFDVQGPGTRVTGLKLVGPSSSVDKDPDDVTLGEITAIGSFSPGPDPEEPPDWDTEWPLLVDHNDLSAWPTAAVLLKVNADNYKSHLEYEQQCPVSRADDVHKVHVLRNWIHENRRDESGYGVGAMYNSWPAIVGNTFDDNRHAIASDGRHGSGYRAIGNLVLGNSPLQNSLSHTHDFDMHGREKDWPFDYWKGRAGNYVEVSYNSFFGRRLHYRFRGKPCHKTDFHHNMRSTEPPGGGQPDFFHGNHSDDDITDFDNLDVRGDHWTPLGESKIVGDLDGDGNAGDRLMATSVAWYYRSADQGEWRFLRIASERTNQVSFADYDGDGRTDARITRPHGRYEYSWGAASEWEEAEWLWDRPPLGGYDAEDVQLALQHDDGQIALWHLAKDGTIDGEAYPHRLTPDWKVVGSGDFNGDKRADLLLRRNDGQVGIWYMKGGRILQEVFPGGQDPHGIFQIQGVVDFDKDGQSDILWRHQDGYLSIWHGGDRHRDSYPSYWNQGGPLPADWEIVGLGDFNGDGYGDIMQRHTSGQLAIWYMKGSAMVGEQYPPTKLDAHWKLRGVGRLDNEPTDDALWWNDQTGQLSVFLDGYYQLGGIWYHNVVGPTNTSWKVQAVTDVNRDGRADIVWREDTGQFAIWFVGNVSFAGEAYPRFVYNDWRMLGGLHRPR
jgi:hypothetical protein